MTIDTTQFRKNLKIEIDGEPFIILEAKHVKPGKGVAFVKTKMKSLESGRVFEENFRSGDTVDTPDIRSREMQYLYKDENHYIFMDEDTYEQVRVSESAVESVVDYLKDNMTLDILFHEGNAIQVDPPMFVELKVTKTDPGIKGNTAQGGTKPATVETGAKVIVPLYLEQGELIKVDTRTGEFVERVNK
ncbi:MAG: elongation factor P [Myxococcota bacterium]